MLHQRKAGVRDYLLVMFLGVLFLWAHFVLAPATPPLRYAVNIDGVAVTVDLARTGAEREKGLSGRSMLPEEEGMLFVFDQPDRYGFWMWDMHFSIDIVWIDSNRRIVDITHDLTPESYPNVFAPSVPALYVLEVPAGTARRHAWKIGDHVEFNGSL
jgi:hypothetical protein